MPTVAIGDFDSAAAPHRRELLVHCYRLLGSAPEAEDLVQETMLRAWRAWERFDPARASVRTWLYRIATNACLSALEGRARRPLPSGLGGASDDTDAPLAPRFEVPWLQPLPGGEQETSALARAGLRLALVAAMQVLPPRQRAVLVLRDVLEFSAAEVAQLLDGSVASVNSALQRARAGLSGAGLVQTELTEPDDAAVRDVLDRFVRAFEAADVDRLVTLLTDDVIMEMPPVPLWYVGRDDYGRFMARVYALCGTDWRMRVITANGGPALAAYCRQDGGPHRIHTIQVPVVTPAGIAHNVVFHDPSIAALFPIPATV